MPMMNRGRIDPRLAAIDAEKRAAALSDAIACLADSATIRARPALSVALFDPMLAVVTHIQAQQLATWGARPLLLASQELPALRRAVALAGRLHCISEELQAELNAQIDKLSASLLAWRMSLHSAA